MRQTGSFIKSIRGIAGISQKVVLLGGCICPSLAWAHSIPPGPFQLMFLNVRSVLCIIAILCIPFLFPFLCVKRYRKTAVKLYRFNFALLVSDATWGRMVDCMTCGRFCEEHLCVISVPICILGTVWLLYELIKHGKLIVKILLPLMVFVAAFFGCWLAFMNDTKLPYGVFIALGVSGMYLLYVGIKEVQSWKKSIKENKK